MAVCHKYSFMGRLSLPVAQARKAAVRFRCDDSKWKRSHGHNRGLGASCPLREGPQGCFICFHGHLRGDHLPLDLLLLLHPQDILSCRPSLLMATSCRQLQYSSSRGGVPYLSTQS
ncbi:hypothetical protein GW17_00061775 [Ensete ventricosum]|nr:hypothetical protein GW17_00061775 [Ensete ventricosum]